MADKAMVAMTTLEAMSPDDHGKMHAMMALGLPWGTILAALHAGLDWKTILQLFLQFGLPMLLKLINDLINGTTTKEAVLKLLEDALLNNE